MLTACAFDNPETWALHWGRMLTVEVVSDGKRMDMAGVGYTTRFFRVGGRPMILGRAAAACLLFLICIMVLEGARCK